MVEAALPSHGVAIADHEADHRMQQDADDEERNATQAVPPDTEAD